MKRRWTKDFDAAIRDALARGWKLARNTGRHQVIERNGAVVAIPSSPSDRRALLNFKMQLRRKERFNA